MRKEEYAQDSRIPIIEFGTPLEDALRRDLTINALFYNLNENKVEDFTGKGIEDLKNGLIRTPLEPLQTFLDDPLRVLRAFRFASRYLFQIDPEILKAIKNDIVTEQLCNKVSRERIGKELEPALENVNGCTFLNHLFDAKLLQIIFQVKEKTLDPVTPEFLINTFESNSKIWNSILSSAKNYHYILLQEHLDNPGQSRCSLLLSSLLYGLHRVRYNKNTSLVEYFIKNSLKLKNRTSDDVNHILNAVQDILNYEKSEKKIDIQTFIALWIRQYGALYPYSIILLITAEPQIEFQKFLETITKYNLQMFHAFKPPVSGNDVLGVFNITGKEVKIVLDSIIIHSITNRDLTKEEFIEWAKIKYEKTYTLK